MSDNYKGKDGLERDIAKLRSTYRIMKNGPLVKDAWRRLKARPTPHNWTNLRVEQHRVGDNAEYYTGHREALKDAGMVIMGGIIIFLLFV